MKESSLGESLGVVLRGTRKLLLHLEKQDEIREELLEALQSTNGGPRRTRRSSTRKKAGAPRGPRAPRGELQAKLLKELETWQSAETLAKAVGLDKKRVYLELNRLKDKLEKRGERGKREYRVSG